MSEHIFLCLRELLDQDITSMEYFNTLPDEVRRRLLLQDDARSFHELQEQGNILKKQLKK